MAYETPPPAELPEPGYYSTNSASKSLGRLEDLSRRVPRYKPLSVGVVLLDLVPAGRHQPPK